MKHLLLVSLLMLSVLAVSCSDDDSTNPPAPEIPKAPTNGLVAEYKFSGNADDTKGSNDGVPAGGPPLVADRFGTANHAYAFDGVDDVITTVSDQFATGNNVSISYWVNMASVAGPLRYFIVCSDFGVYTSGANAGISISTPSTNSAPGAITASSWHHVLGTYDGTDIRCYIDGALVNTVTHAGNLDDSDRPLTLGLFGGNYWTGTVDDVRIYSRTISSAGDISNLYHEGGYAQ